MFGAKLKLVTGYQGGADMTLALERGEVDGRCGWSLGGIKTSRPSWLKDGPVNIPVQLGLRGSPDLAGIPLIMDQAANDQQRRILKLIISRPGTGLCVRRAAGPARRPDQGAANGLRPDHEGS
jgi:hypothetical protein